MGTSRRGFILAHYDIVITFCYLITIPKHINDMEDFCQTHDDVFFFFIFFLSFDLFSLMMILQMQFMKKTKQKPT